MNNKCSPEFTFVSKGSEVHLYLDCKKVLTYSGKVSNHFIDTVTLLENGQRIYGYVKHPRTKTSSIAYQLYPKKFERAVLLLMYLGVSPRLIDEDPKTATKNKYVIVDLSPEQQEKLYQLKNLCN